MAGGEVREFRAEDRCHRRCRGGSPGDGRAMRGGTERQGRGAAGRAALARAVHGRRRRRLGADDPPRADPLPAPERDPGHREGRHGDALQARQARHPAPRPAPALARARGLGRGLARVQAAVVRAARAARRRALRRGDGRGAAAVPARTRPHARRDRGREDLPCAGAWGEDARGEAEATRCGACRRPRRRARRGIQRDRTPLPRRCRRARAQERPDPGERDHARPAPSHPGHRARAEAGLRRGARRRRSCTPCSPARGSSRSRGGTASRP